MKKDYAEDGYSLVAYVYPGQGDKRLCRSAMRLVQIDGRAAVYSNVTDALRDEHHIIALSTKNKRPVWLCVLSSIERLMELTKDGRTTGRKVADSAYNRD